MQLTDCLYCNVTNTVSNQIIIQLINLLPNNSLNHCYYHLGLVDHEQLELIHEQLKTKLTPQAIISYEVVVSSNTNWTQLARLIKLTNSYSRLVLMIEDLHELVNINPLLSLIKSTQVAEVIIDFYDDQAWTQPTWFSCTQLLALAQLKEVNFYHSQSDDFIYHWLTNNHPAQWIKHLDGDLMVANYQNDYLIRINGGQNYYGWGAGAISKINHQYWQCHYLVDQNIWISQLIHTDQKSYQLQLAHEILVYFKYQHLNNKSYHNYCIICNYRLFWPVCHFLSNNQHHNYYQLHALMQAWVM